VLSGLCVQAVDFFVFFVCFVIFVIRLFFRVFWYRPFGNVGDL